MFLRNLLQASAILPFLYTTTTAQNACNNDASLCSRAYNNITHLGAHDSPFLRDSSTSFSTSGNHYYNTTVQLDAGVRLLSAQVHKVSNNSGSDAWHLCHSSCDLLDAGTLESWLIEIKSWMDRNINDVVTILLVNSDDALPSDLGPQFERSGISELAYAPPELSTVPTTWPTLDTLISNNTRLITFVANIATPSPQYPYLLDEFSLIFENDFENINPQNYSCTPNRPSAVRNNPSAALNSGRMFLMNHFLYEQQFLGIQSPNASYAEVTNGLAGFGALGTQVQNCTTVYGKPPTFVLVDWFNVGPAIASVDRANGVANAVGRKQVSEEPLSPTGGVGRRQGSLGAVVMGVVVAVLVAV